MHARSTRGFFFRILTVVVATFGAAGCEAVVVDEPTDEAAASAGPTRNATLYVKWELRNDDGSWAACNAGYDKVRVTAEAFAPGDVASGVMFVALTDCNMGKTSLVVPIDGEAKPRDGSASARKVTPKYVVRAAQTDATGTSDKATASAVTVDLASGDATTSFTLRMERN